MGRSFFFVFNKLDDIRFSLGTHIPVLRTNTLNRLSGVPVPPTLLSQAACGPLQSGVECEHQFPYLCAPDKSCSQKIFLLTPRF